ncbi:MAG: hypothetical protein U0446_12395 [Dehalococcoidia bacterium]
MEWDLGIRGVALLAGMSLAFGAAAQLLFWRSTPHWLWAASAAAFFVFGIMVSEWWFGWATEEDLQPNIDGLSTDEVLLIAVWPSLALVLAIRYWTLRHRAPQREK